MPRRPSGNTVAVSIKVPKKWLDEADEFVELAAKTAINRPTRTDILRHALRAGLSAMNDLYNKPARKKRAR